MLTQAKLVAALTVAVGVIAAYIIDANVFRLPRF
jgi:hypothetical protein